MISPRFDDAREFSERRAAVMRLGMVRDDFYKPRWGYIAPTGELMVPYRYDEVCPSAADWGASTSRGAAMAMSTVRVGGASLSVRAGGGFLRFHGPRAAGRPRLQNRYQGAGGDGRRALTLV